VGGYVDLILGGSDILRDPRTSRRPEREERRGEYHSQRGSEDKAAGCMGVSKERQRQKRNDDHWTKQGIGNS